MHIGLGEPFHVLSLVGMTAVDDIDGTEQSIVPVGHRGLVANAEVFSCRRMTFTVNWEALNGEYVGDTQLSPKELFEKCRICER